MSDNINLTDMPRYREREVPEAPAWIQEFLDAEVIRNRAGAANEGDYDSDDDDDIPLATKRGLATANLGINNAPRIAGNNSYAGAQGGSGSAANRFANDNSDDDIGDSLAGFIATARKSMAARARNRDPVPAIFHGAESSPGNSPVGELYPTIASTYNAARLVVPRRLSLNSTLQRADMFARHYLGVEAREQEAERTADRLLFTGYVRNLQLAGPSNNLFRAYRLPDTNIDPVSGDSIPTTHGSIDYSNDEV